MTGQMSWQGRHLPAPSPHVWDFGWGSQGSPRFYPGLFVEGGPADGVQGEPDSVPAVSGSGSSPRRAGVAHPPSEDP